MTIEPDYGVVNVSIGGWYPRGQARLLKSLQSFGFSGALFLWLGELPPGSPTHKCVPYAFKPFALIDAFHCGIRYLLWLDASMYLTASIDPLFAIIRERGALAFKNREYTSAAWTHDACLKAFGVTRAEAERIPMLASGIVGFDMRHPVGGAIARDWLDSVTTNPEAWRGSWANHRHDQSVLTLLWHTYKMPLMEVGLYSHTPAESVAETCVVCQGL
jgi:hypothetical protein